VPKLIACGTEKDQTLNSHHHHAVLLATFVDFGSLNRTLHVDCGQCSLQKGQFTIAHMSAVRT